MNSLNWKAIAINSLTWYRILAAPALLVLILLDYPNVFKWLLVFSFFTDSIDGPLSRLYKVASVKGARLDSLGDDLTIAVALVGIARWNFMFLTERWVWILFLLLLLAVEMALAWKKYHKMTAFHTYLSKGAAVFQAFYLCGHFLLGQPPEFFFYLVVLITALGLLEEIVLVLLLKDYQCDVRGLYWLRTKLR
jgi:phosphatidylglycerophosphate synthase